MRISSTKVYIYAERARDVRVPFVYLSANETRVKGESQPWTMA